MNAPNNRLQLRANSLALERGKHAAHRADLEREHRGETAYRLWSLPGLVLLLHWLVGDYI